MTFQKEDDVTIIKKSFCSKALWYLVIALGVIVFFSTSPEAQTKTGSTPGRETVNVIFISDKITDIAYHLGVVPVAYCGSCSWPMAQKELSTVAGLGCYRCATVDSVIKKADQHNVRMILIEDGRISKFKNHNWKDKYFEPLKKHGYEVYTISFSKGVPQAILEIGKLLHRQEKAGELAETYTRVLGKTMKAIPASGSGKKILILQGVGRRGIRVESPDGYAEQYLIGPLGCINVGNLAKGQDAEVDKGYFILDNWHAIAKADPDIIVKYGNVCTVEKGLVRALKKYPGLSDVTAIKNHAVYTVPSYMGSSVIEYPQILRAWYDTIYN
jgi:ABC-type Fe3+-hydroxamate transport system substrate-binding protein